MLHIEQEQSGINNITETIGNYLHINALALRYSHEQSMQFVPVKNNFSFSLVLKSIRKFAYKDLKIAV